MMHLLCVPRGARHGLKLNGKLARIEEQERQLLADRKNDDKKIHMQNRMCLTATDYISSSQDESVCVQKKLHQLDETEMVIEKKKKKSKRRLDKDTAHKLLLQSELCQTDANANPNDKVAKCKKVDFLSTTTDRTQHTATTNEACTLVDESTMLKRKRKTKKSKGGIENYQLSCEGMENVKEYQNIAAVSSGAKERNKNKWKAISLEGTVHTEDTFTMDTAHKEHSGCHSKKKKKKKSISRE